MMFPFTAENIFVVAEQFFYGEKALLGLRNESYRHDIDGPALALSAFSAELYLKCLVTIETNQTPRGHDLKDLFLMLKPATQARLRKDFEQDITELEKVIYRQYPDEKTRPVINLDFALEASRDAFVRLRYMYEGTRANQGWILGGLVIDLRKLLIELHPEWLSARAISHKAITSTDLRER